MLEGRVVPSQHLVPATRSHGGPHLLVPGVLAHSAGSINIWGNTTSWPFARSNVTSRVRYPGQVRRISRNPDAECSIRLDVDRRKLSGAEGITETLVDSYLPCVVSVDLAKLRRTPQAQHPGICRRCDHAAV